MLVAVLKEKRPHEQRVAATPETVKKMKALGLDVTVEPGAGTGASIPDSAFAEAGAHVESNLSNLLSKADVVLKVQRPLTAGEGAMDELSMMKSGAHVIALLSPLNFPESPAIYAKKGVNAFALEMIPRITRAQSMDVLSSQSNLAGYRAVLEASYVFNRGFPMMMTAAGTVPPARVFVMGAGVAGLQAIATARRLGAVVSATDVRPVAKEQVESLGATFVMVDSDEVKQAETSGGYAKEMSDDYKRRQAALVAETIKKQDIVICTALIPGKKAPTLVSEADVRSMKPGSVIVDLAVEQGGNCALSKPGEVVDVNSVKIIGYANMPSRIAADASALYARNVLNFLTLLVNKETRSLSVPWDDDIVKGTALTRDGQVIHPQFLKS